MGYVVVRVGGTVLFNTCQPHGNGAPSEGREILFLQRWLSFGRVVTTLVHCHGSLQTLRKALGFGQIDIFCRKGWWNS